MSYTGQVVPGDPDRDGGRDWTYKAADQIEAIVGQVRDKTTVPITYAARGLVYGLVAGVLGAVMLFFLVVALVRVLDVYVPLHPLGRRVWIVDAGASAIFLVAGAFLWRMRRPKGAKRPS